ncbi:MAG TPA: zinc permease [Actinomycetota bacterium]|nr:zinc permease [Actinomycetota bacterium]
MSNAGIVGLGAIAGLTIFLGLPVCRVRSAGQRVRTLLVGASAGILIFLLVDILNQAGEPVGAAASAGDWGRLAGYGSVYVLGFGFGLLSLVYLSAWQKRRLRRASIGPGAMAVAERLATPQADALRTGMSIATAIGLHNFSEGLAIGQSASRGAMSLALVLIIGFALHNATEGFGIGGPLAAAQVQAPWKWLLVAGIVGGGPTFLGTVVGASFTSPVAFVGCLALAAGAVLYCIGELFAAGRRMAWNIVVWGVMVGFLVAFGTDLVLKAAGA